MVPNNTIEQSPSWEPHRSSVSQEIPRTLCNTNVYYHIHKSPPPVHILSQINPVQSPHPTSWRSISILSSHLLLGLPSGLFPSRFSHQKPVCTSPLPHTCYMPRPSHFLRFCRPNSIWWGVQIIKFLIMQFSPLPCYFVPLRPKYSPLHPTLKHPQPMFLRYCERQVSHPYKTTREIIIRYILIIFGWQTGRQKILHWMIVSIPGRSLRLTGNILSQNKITKAFCKSSLKLAVNEILMQKLFNIWTSLEQLLKCIWKCRKRKYLLTHKLNAQL